MAVGRRLATATLQVALGAGVALGGCVPGLQGTLPRPQPQGAPATFTAGAAVVDITPPPGYPMAGHGKDGELSRGVWTRLQARAIAFVDPAGTPLLLVSADLWAMPAGLVDRVAERMADDPRGRGVAREHLLVAATHTHHGPANFGSSRYFNHASSPDPGFDPVLFEFLAERIAEAALRALEQRSLARVLRRDVAVPTLTRNDGIEAFVANPEARDILRDHALLPGCMDAQATVAADPCHAVDPVLTTLEVVTDDDRRIAVAAFFAIDPATMPARTAVHHADVWGTARTRVHRGLARTDDDANGEGPPVVAFFNGAQADTVPNLAEPGRAAATEIGYGLGDAVLAALAEPPRPIASTIGIAYGKVVFEDRPRARKGEVPRPRDHYARVLPVSVVSLGPTVLVGLPGEFTTVMGQRVAARATAAIGSVEAGVPVGLAGGHGFVFPTPDEYAHETFDEPRALFGLEAGPAVAAEVERIATEHWAVTDTQYAYAPGRAWAWDGGPGSALASETKTDDGRVGRDLDVASARAATWTFDDAPTPWPAGGPDVDVTPRVQVQVKTGEGWTLLRHDGLAVDDETDAFASWVTGVEDDRWTWRTTWLAPGGADPAQDLRLRVRRVDGGVLCSPPFSLSALFGGEKPGALSTANCE